MRLVPLGDKVVIRKIEAEEATAGGILLPELARDKTKQGRVLSVGDGRLLADGTRAKPVVAEGDRVIFSDYSGMKVTVNGEELLIMGEDDILAIVSCLRRS